jgi:recombination protein RecA
MARKKVAFGVDQTPEFKSLAAVGAAIKSFRPGPEVIRSVRAVPTILPQYDAMTRVGGHPIDRIALIHGPSNEGKSTLTMAMGKSFLQRGHFYALVDTERTMPRRWMSQMLGPWFTSPGFLALPSTTYEETSDAVREFCETVAEKRIKREIPEETSGIVVVDSLRKLVPKKLLKELLKGGATKSGVDGFSGRGGQMKAALNAAWVDELVPLMADTGMSIAFVGRETDKVDAGLYEEQFKVGGGSSIYFDSSVVVRVMRKFIPHPDEALAKTGAHVGERHILSMRKTKVAVKESKRPTAAFHTSNGVLCPVGFDTARDLLEMGVDSGVVDQKGSWYVFDGKKLGNGELAALRTLWSDADLLAELDKAARAAMPLEKDDE